MGIAILGGFIVYIVITLAVLVIAVKYFTGIKRKWVVSSLVILISILIPTWDIPIGRINFNHLCNTQAGQFINKQVSLSDEYFLKAGERNIRYFEHSKFAYAKGGELDLERVKQNYVINSNYDKDYSRWGYIYKLETKIIFIQDKQILGRAVTFFYRGGWLMASFEGGGSIDCPDKSLLGSNKDIHETIIDKTFQPITPRN